MGSKFFSVTFLIVSSFTILSLCVRSATACHGYEIRNTQIDWCSDKEKCPLKLEGIKLKMDESCHIKMEEGKIVWSQPIKTMEVDYEGGSQDTGLIEMAGSIEDFCKSLEEMKKEAEEVKSSKDLLEVMEFFGMKGECPKKKKVVLNSEIDISKWVTKSTWSTLMWGRNDFNFTMETDNGGSCCIMLQVYIGKIDEDSN